MLLKYIEDLLIFIILWRTTAVMDMVVREIETWQYVFNSKIQREYQLEFPKEEVILFFELIYLNQMF